MHAGDSVQIRRTLQLDDREPLHNGTGAEVTAIDVNGHEIELRVSDDKIIRFTEQQMADADLQLASSSTHFQRKAKPSTLRTSS